MVRARCRGQQARLASGNVLIARDEGVGRKGHRAADAPRQGPRPKAGPPAGRGPVRNNENGAGIVSLGVLEYAADHRERRESKVHGASAQVLREGPGGLASGAVEENNEALAGGVVGRSMAINRLGT